MFFNNDHNVFRTFFASAALAASTLMGSAFGAPVDCNDLAISYTQLPSEVQAELEIAIGDTLFVPGLADPIVDIRIRPATMLDPTEAFICDTDYGADLDDAGNATLWFARGGPYYAQVTRQSGLTQGASIGVGCTFRAASGGGGKPDWVEVPKPPHDVALHDPGHTPGMLQPWTDPKPATGLDDAAGQICAASESEGGKVDVVIDAHGNSGGMHLGDDWLDSTTACDFGNDISGKVGCLTLFSCNVGDDLAMLCTVADKSGATVKAYTGKVVNIGDDVFVEDGESEVTKEPKPKVRDIEVMRVEMLEGADADKIDTPEGGGIPIPLSPPPVLLPIDAFTTNFYDAILLMLEAWGEGNSGWDLDHSGAVDSADLALLMELAP